MQVKSVGSGKQLLWGLLGAILASPFAIYFAGFAAKNSILINVFGSDWTVFRSLAGMGVMVGFAIGYQIAKQINNDAKENEK